MPDLAEVNISKANKGVDKLKNTKSATVKLILLSNFHPV